MRTTLAGLGLLVCCGPLLAAGVRPPAKAPARPLDPLEAQGYAQHVVYALDAIERQYVREVSRKDLMLEALTALYDAARLPLPATLEADVDKTFSAQDRQDLLTRVREQVGPHDALKGTNAALISIRAMLKSLDPYSTLVSAEELNRGNDPGAQQGVGLELADNVSAGPLVIQAVAPGGPAQRAGLRPGDQITRLDGKPVQGLNAAQVQQRLLGRAVPPERMVPAAAERGVQVRVTYLRHGSRVARKAVLESIPFRPETVWGVSRRADNRWDFLVDREERIAQVRLGPLGHNTADELKEVLTGLKADGVRGLILDLRWSPGGYLREAYKAASLFLREGAIATVKYRNSQENEEEIARGDGSFADLPMIVLVNADTTGGAELIAAALQDNKRAVIAGQRTRGKASVQSLISLTVGSVGMKLTRGTFQRPSGKNLHRFPESKSSDDWGVRPDPKHEFRVSAELGRRLQEWWQLQTLRPGSSREALPLDDPAADPQRQAAVQALRAQLKRSARAAGAAAPRGN